MKRKLALFVLAVGLCIFVASASAETIFNEMAKCISDMDKCGTSGAQKGACAQAPAASTARPDCRTDCMGNKVPAETCNTGRITL